MVRDFARRNPDEPPLRIWQRTYQAITHLCAQAPATADPRLLALIAELRTVVQDIGYRPAPGSGAMRSIQKWVADARRTVSPPNVGAPDGAAPSRTLDLADLAVAHPWEPGTGQLSPAQERYVWEAVASVDWNDLEGDGARFGGWLAWGPTIKDAQHPWPDVGEARWAAYLAEVAPVMPTAERVRWATWLSACATGPLDVRRALWRGLAGAIRAARPSDYVPSPAEAGGCPAIPSREREVDRDLGEGVTDG
jgi:hypothetical protein